MWYTFRDSVPIGSVFAILDFQTFDGGGTPCIQLLSGMANNANGSIQSDRGMRAKREERPFENARLETFEDKVLT